MAKGIFFSLPVHGHVNPSLPLVRELVRRGDEIVYYSTTQFAEQVEATGAAYRSYRNAFLPELGAAARRVDELAWLFMRTTSEVLDEELEICRADQADYLLTDSVAPWGQWMGQLLDLPVVTSVSTFAFNSHVLRYGSAHGVRPRDARYVLSKLRHVGKALWLRRRLQRRHGVRGPSLMALLSGHSGLTLVYTSRAFQPCGETFDERYRFVGPLIGPRTDAPFPWEQITHPVLVYVSLGTLFNTDAAFYQVCFEAFRGADFQVVLSVGRRVSIDSLGPPPANVMVLPHVPQVELLTRAAAFVTHGGMNSVSEGLFHGVPLVVIPQMSEQEIVGRRTEELGAGVFLAKAAVTPERLRASVMRVLTNGSFRQWAGVIQTSLRSAGGVGQAGDCVQAFTGLRVNPAVES